MTPSQRAFADKPTRAFVRGLSVYNKETKRVERFKPRDYQDAIIDLVESGCLRVLVVKARQLGLSTVIRAIFYKRLYEATQPIRHAVVSHEVESANEIFEMDSRFQKSLPESFRPELERAATRVTKIAESGAQSSTFTAKNSDALRSYAMESAHLSEGAFYDDLADTISIVDAAVGATGLIVLESTAYGYDDAFHKLVKASIAGENEWKVVFVAWWQNPIYEEDPGPGFQLTRAESAYADKVHEKTGHRLTRRQMAWRRLKLRALNNDRKRLMREFPSFIDECFQSTASAHYDSDALDEIEPAKRTRPKPGQSYEAILSRPEPRTRDWYVVSVDTAQGVGGDYSAITVISALTRQPVYHWWSQWWGPKACSEQLLRVADDYTTDNPPVLAIESNNHGHQVLAHVRAAKYSERRIWKYKGKDFVTNVATRPLIFAALREMIDERLIHELEEEVLEELRGIISGPDERPDHPPGGHDDRVVSLGLGYLALKELKVPMLPREQARRQFESLIDKARARRTSRALPWTPV